MKFSGERPGGESITFTCHIISLNDIFQALEEENNDSLVSKLADGIHPVV